VSGYGVIDIIERHKTVSTLVIGTVLKETGAMPGKIEYQRVNLAEIETSSDEDDYGDIFAKERRNGATKGRPLRHSSKKKDFYSSILTISNGWGCYLHRSRGLPTDKVRT